jgi:hypothetical protein
MAQTDDLAGQTFGRLTILQRAPNDKRGHAAWLCKCECGNTKVVLARFLTRGDTKSCGCLRRQRLMRNRRMLWPSSATDYEFDQWGEH